MSDSDSPRAPVHRTELARMHGAHPFQFLLRHVYASTIAAFRLSKFQASFVTFLLSACVHELVMVGSAV